MREPNNYAPVPARPLLAQIFALFLSGWPEKREKKRKAKWRQFQIQNKLACCRFSLFLLTLAKLAKLAGKREKEEEVGQEVYLAEVGFLRRFCFVFGWLE